MLLSTDSKDKIGKNLAYPVGAELISDAVVGIAQAAQISISFRSKTTVWASQFNQILRDRTDYTLIKCSIHAEGGRYAGVLTNLSWQIIVYPVLREFKATAREALLIEGFPVLKEYLLRTGSPEGQNRYPLVIRFSPIEQKVYV